MLWIFLVAFYGLAKGGRSLLNKGVLKKYSSFEVLFAYNFCSLILVLPTVISHAQLPSPQMSALVVCKSIAVFSAFSLSFYSLKHIPVSLFGVLDMSRVLFSTIFGALILHETIKINGYIGLIMVCIGLVMLKAPTKKSSKGTATSSTVYIFIALLSCALNSTSGMLDKIIMQSLTSKQLQFWFILLLFVFSVIYALITRAKIRFSALLREWKIWLMSLLLIAADRALFEACAMQSSRLTAMALIKQCSVIVIIIGGKIFFGEKNLLRRTLCAVEILLGIAISLIEF